MFNNRTKAKAAFTAALVGVTMLATTDSTSAISHDYYYSDLVYALCVSDGGSYWGSPLRGWSQGCMYHDDGLYFTCINNQFGDQSRCWWD